MHAREERGKGEELRKERGEKKISTNMKWGYKTNREEGQREYVSKHINMINYNRYLLI